MSIIVHVDVFTVGIGIREARILGGKYAGQGATTREAVERVRERTPVNELPTEPEFRTLEHVTQFTPELP